MTTLSKSQQLNLVFPDDMTEQEVISELTRRLPIETLNDLYSAMYTYKNAIIRDYLQEKDESDD